jgi:hypothetical protein
MKFQPDTLPGVNTITRHDPAACGWAPRRLAHSLLVPWVGEVQAWDGRHARTP